MRRKQRRTGADHLRARARTARTSAARQRRYLISMAIRTLCFILAVVSIGHWFMWVFLVGAVFLPYVAVVMANAGAHTDPGASRTRVRPRPAGAPRPPRRPPVSDEPDGSRWSARRRGARAAAALDAALEQPEAAHAGPPQGVAGLRGAPRVARGLPRGARLPRRTAVARRPGVDPVAAQPPMADIGRAAAGTSRRRCRGRGAWAPSRAPPAVGELLVGRAAAQRGAQVGLLAGEQAVAHLAVGGEPDPVAVAAERPGDRGDDADRRRSAVDGEQLGRRAAARLLGVGSA